MSGQTLSWVSEDPLLSSPNSGSRSEIDMWKAPSSYRRRGLLRTAIYVPERVSNPIRRALL